MANKNNFEGTLYIILSLVYTMQYVIKAVLLVWETLSTYNYIYIAYFEIKFQNSTPTTAGAD